jgi:hypothetical protein
VDEFIRPQVRLPSEDARYWDGQNCGNCYWADNPFPYAGQRREDALLQCAWPAELLPDSLTYGNRERMSVSPDNGNKCPQWRDRVPKQPRLFDPC